MEARNNETSVSNITMMQQDKKISSRKTNLVDTIEDKEGTLKWIKDNINASNDFFQMNYQKFNEYKKFVYESTLTESDISALEDQGKPKIEFNQIGAFLSRLIGEFFKFEPDAKIEFDDEWYSYNQELIDIIENHIQHDLNDSKSKRMQCQIYSDLLCGMSAVKIYTEYKSQYSFDQVIKFMRKDPTMCGWDVNAIEPNKSDGQYCFEKFSYTLEQFKREFPNVDYNNAKSIGGNYSSDMPWSFSSKNKKVIIICDYYEKKIKKVPIVQLSDGSIMKKKEYERKAKLWQAFRKTSMPTIVDYRKTDVTTIERYKIINNEILSYEKTDYNDLPYIFIGKTEVIKDSDNSNVREIILPYFKNAIGAQRFVNYAGACFANALENSVQSKIMMTKEAFPTDSNAQYFWLNPQKASVLLYNGFDEKIPDRQIPPPQPVMTQNMPPEISQAFSSSMTLMQNALGSFDSSLGINQNQLSGIAITEGATQSNAAAMPYLSEFLMGMSKIYIVYLNLFPKYYSTPRTIPIIDKEGRKSFAEINTNEKNKVSFDYNELGVQIKIGAASSIEKYKALAMMGEVSAKFPSVAQFINGDGTDIILKNMDIKGSEQLQSRYPEWKKMQQQNQQAAMQNNPEIMKHKIEQQKISLEADKMHNQLTIDAMQIQKDTKKMLADFQQSQMDNETKRMQAQVQRENHMIELMKEQLIHRDNHSLKKKDQVHKHAKEAIEMHHKISSDNKPKEIVNSTQGDDEDDAR